MDITTKLDNYKNLSRKDYFDKNQELGKNLWDNENIPTVADIADFMNGNTENEKMNRLFDFFDNKEDFMKMATRSNNSYSQDESSNFIRKVMSANNSDISKAGYFYKLLMASADDFTITESDCRSQGVEYNVKSVNEDIYNYRIKFSFINELKNYCRWNYNEFVNYCKNNSLENIHVRTPLTCSHAKSHCICKKCSGALPSNTTNIGTFTALMVTEHATQSALSSMNKGRKENINDLLTIGFTGKSNPSWENITEWICNIVNKLENKNVSSRFYEIALLSRVRKENGNFIVCSLKSSINYSGNLFGAYIFTPTNKNFEKIIKAKQFDDNSLKLQIAINDYKGTNI